jgi:hypothetical protein
VQGLVGQPLALFALAGSTSGSAAAVSFTKAPPLQTAVSSRAPTATSKPTLPTTSVRTATSAATTTRSICGSRRMEGRSGRSHYQFPMTTVAGGLDRRRGDLEQPHGARHSRAVWITNTERHVGPSADRIRRGSRERSLCCLLAAPVGSHGYPPVSHRLSGSRVYLECPRLRSPRRRSPMSWWRSRSGTLAPSSPDLS